MDRANIAVNDQLKNIIKYFFVRENVHGCYPRLFLLLIISL